MRHLDALHPHIQEPQDKRRVEPRGAHDRGDPDTLGRHHHRLHIVQVEAGVLHVDKGGVKPGEPDDLDDLRIGDAADMGSERQAALAQDALYPIFRFMIPSLARSADEAMPRVPVARAAGWR